MLLLGLKNLSQAVFIKNKLQIILELKHYLLKYLPQ